MKRDRGFSLLELLIVVAIILIIGTIAAPSFLRARQTANENSAVGNLRSLHTAQITYGQSNNGVYGTVEDLVTAGLVDMRYLTRVSGYAFDVILSPEALDFTIAAAATSAGAGRYDYYSIAQDHIIRYSTSPDRAPAGLAGEPVR